LKVTFLDPQPLSREAFNRSRLKFVSKGSGCYALTTFQGVVLYVGLATSLRGRMTNHLDSPDKTSPTSQGRATFFHWFETSDTERIERTWMNIHIQHEGALPILNSVYSPVGQ